MREYKQAPGEYEGVTRQAISEPEAAKFQTRYFEVAPGGYTSLERHQHDHVVIVVRGAGEVLLGDAREAIEPFDLIEVPPMTPHQFKNTGGEPLGFLCIVDKDRDRPEPLTPANTVNPGERPIG